MSNKIVDLETLRHRESDLARELERVRSIIAYVSEHGVNADIDLPVESTDESSDQFAGKKAPDSFRSVDVAVRREITGITGNFTASAIEESLRSNGDNFNKSSIFTVVSKLRAGGELVVVSEGAGRRPTIYRKSDKFVDTPF